MKDNEGNEIGEEVIRFGYWIVTAEGIYWSKGVGHDYFLPKGDLNSPRPDNDKDKYDLLLQLAEKTWMTELDLYQLNTAYFYALDYFNLDRLSDSTTLEKQLKAFNDSRPSDEAEDDEISI